MGLINFNIQLPSFGNNFGSIGDRFKSAINSKLNFTGSLNETSFGSSIENAMSGLESKLGNINMDTMEMPEINTESILNEAMGGVDFNSMLDEQISRINSGEFDDF